MLRYVPGIRFFTQYPSQASERWRFAGSVLDGYAARPGHAPSRPLRVVVTVGSQRTFGFRRLIERLLDVLPETAQVTWQTGASEVRDLGIRARAFMPEEELRAEIESADVVVSHGGIGSALMALDAGRMAIVVPRLERHGEHVDDHQRQIVAELDRRGLAIGCEVDDLEPAMIERAANTMIEAADAAAIELPLGG
jgi:UDP-N-acetylglucosamine transferase subunit ALG13